MRPTALLLCSFVIAGCYAQAANTEADVEAITAIFAEFDAAATAGDVDGLLALYADDVVSMPPDMPPRIGAEVMRAPMEEFTAQFDLALTSQVEEVQVSGDIAYALVSWEQTMTPKAEGEATHEQGKWMLVFKRQADGSWKCWREMWSTYEPAEM